MGIAFEKSGSALVSERSSGRLIEIDSDGKKSTLGEVSGVQAPSGLGEGGFLGIAPAPGDEETVFAYITTADDTRMVRFSIAGGKVGTPKALVHRDVQGLALDAGKRLWATEFGDKAVDELNLITRGGNCGWPQVEGRSDNSAYVATRQTWSPTSTSSPSGLAITRSTAFVAALQGSAVLDDLGRSAAKPGRTSPASTGACAPWWSLRMVRCG